MTPEKSIPKKYTLRWLSVSQVQAPEDAPVREQAYMAPEKANGTSYLW
jgi:hypothetical protein